MFFNKKNKREVVSTKSDKNLSRKQQEWTAVYSNHSNQLVAAYNNGIISYYHNALASWYECGKCADGMVYNTYNNQALVGRVERVNGSYHCILDFRERTASTIDFYKNRIKESPASDHRLEYERIKELELHVSELDVGYVQNNSVFFHERLVVGNPLRLNNLLPYSTLYAEPNNAFELAAVFVCLQSMENTDINEEDKPFLSLYP